MAARDSFEDRAWKEIINAWMTGDWIDGTIALSKDRPTDPFADTGPLLERLLQAGASRDDICRLARHVSYEACFQMLTTMEEEELCEDSLHEGFLSGDPSGLEGRPGSWPIVEKKKSRKRRDALDDALLIVPKASTMDISADGRRILVCPRSISSGIVTVWNLLEKSDIVSFKTVPNIRGALFSPDGTSIAVGAHSGAVCQHDAATGQQLWKTKATNKEIRNIAWSSDGAVVMSAGSDTCLTVRDAKTGKEIARLAVEGSRFVSGVAVSPDGLTFAAASYSDTVGPLASFWNSATRQHIRTFGIEDYRIFQFNHDGSQLIAGGSRGVFFYNTADGYLIRSLKIADTSEVTLSPDDRFLAVTNSTDPFRIFDARTGELLKTMDFKGPWLWEPVFSRDGKLLALPADRKGYVYEVEKLLEQ